MTPFPEGSRVAATVYGIRLRGVVLAANSPGIRWVLWDTGQGPSSGRRRWIHTSSLEAEK